MTIRVVEGWAEAPLRAFAEESRVRLALLLQPSGRVVGQAGFARALDVMSACALAAAIHATSSELGRQLDGRPFGALHHPGAGQQLFLAEAGTPGGAFLLLAVFDETASLGLVQLSFREFRDRLRTAIPPEAPPVVLAAEFERDLTRNLATLFGRA